MNGAILLDAGIGLKTRPYTLLLYGHNMKTGAMFGSLRNYEKLSFYQKNPFITFDSLYEDGRYVIFAASDITTVPGTFGYVDFNDLLSSDTQKRQAAIDALTFDSAFTCAVEVQPDDQLLLLITCVEDDEERRVVAARRVREDEDEAALKKQVEKSRSR